VLVCVCVCVCVCVYVCVFVRVCRPMSVKMCLNTEKYEKIQQVHLTGALESGYVRMHGPDSLLCDIHL